MKKKKIPPDPPNMEKKHKNNKQHTKKEIK